jgi:hypothetical protein
VYIGEVDDHARMEISTVTVAYIDVLRSCLDYSCCDMCEGTLIVADVLRSGLDYSGCDMCEGTLIVTVDW